jgi:hypothetical protein
MTGLEKPPEVGKGRVVFGDRPGSIICTLTVHDPLKVASLAARLVLLEREHARHIFYLDSGPRSKVYNPISYQEES